MGTGSRVGSGLQRFNQLPHLGHGQWVARLHGSPAGNDGQSPIKNVRRLPGFDRSQNFGHHLRSDRPAANDGHGANAAQGAAEQLDLEATCQQLVEVLFERADLGTAQLDFCGLQEGWRSADPSPPRSESNRIRCERRAGRSCTGRRDLRPR